MQDWTGWKEKVYHGDEGDLSKEEKRKEVDKSMEPRLHLGSYRVYRYCILWLPATAQAYTVVGVLQVLLFFISQLVFFFLNNNNNNVEQIKVGGFS